MASLSEQSSSSLDIGAADILRLIQGHLTSVGLHEANRVLREESGIGAAGVPHRMLKTWASQGQWAWVLRTLSMIDRERCRLDINLIAQVHEMAILEVAAAGDLEIAYSLFRLSQPDLEASHLRLSESQEKITRARNVEQKLAALAAARIKDPGALLPDDYYGENTSRDKIRKSLGQKLESAIPEQPANRLVVLLQQAIKYQSYTGELPQVKQWWPDEEGEEDQDTQHRKKKRRKVFDLVLGTAEGEPAVVGNAVHRHNSEPTPSYPMATVKFGKKAVCESAVFLHDGSGLVTGSSDGLIEIWDAAQSFGSLRIDLPYQQREELLGHDVAVTALAVSNDGALLASGDVMGNVQIWRIDTGKCLRSLSCHSQAISCLKFSPDGSRVLTASQDGKSREFGLRTSNMLKEFAGHDSFVTSCSYVLHSSSSLRVVTGAADGLVRIFDGSSADCIRVLKPPPNQTSGQVLGSSISVDVTSTSLAENFAIAGVFPLHAPAQTMIIVPRGLRAFLVNFVGVVLKVYEDHTASQSPFCAAAVSASNKWLYAVKEDGNLCIFDIENAKLEVSIPHFGSESTKKSKDEHDKANADVTDLVSHPNQNIIAAFSNDKGQKRGQLVVWN